MRRVLSLDILMQILYTKLTIITRIPAEIFSDRTILSSAEKVVAFGSAV
jgi:hypothetical protein